MAPGRTAVGCTAPGREAGGGYLRRVLPAGQWRGKKPGNLGYSDPRGELRVPNQVRGVEGSSLRERNELLPRDWADLLSVNCTGLGVIPTWGRSIPVHNNLLTVRSALQPVQYMPECWMETGLCTEVEEVGGDSGRRDNQ